jgi:Ca2+-binding EF-hand superfamily protein
MFRHNIEEAFDKFNKDGNDYLDKEEFKNFMLEANPKASQELLDEIYNDMDENGDE